MRWTGCHSRSGEARKSGSSADIGSGKTTIAAMSRLYKHAMRAVVLDSNGIDMQHVPSLVSPVAVARRGPRQSEPFTGRPERQSLLMGNLKPSDENLIEVSREGSLSSPSWCSSPRLHMPVWRERGNLSSGQKTSSPLPGAARRPQGSSSSTNPPLHDSRQLAPPHRLPASGDRSDCKRSLLFPPTAYSMLDLYRSPDLIENGKIIADWPKEQGDSAPATKKPMGFSVATVEHDTPPLFSRYIVVISACFRLWRFLVWAHLANVTDLRRGTAIIPLSRRRSSRQ